MSQLWICEIRSKDSDGVFLKFESNLKIRSKFLSIQNPYIVANNNARGIQEGRL